MYHRTNSYLSSRIQKYQLTVPVVCQYLLETPRNHFMVDLSAQKKRDICTFDHSVRVMNNHAGLILTRPTGTTFSHLLNPF